MASTKLVRMRFAGVAVKTETTIGTDVFGGTVSSADFIAATLDATMDPVIIQNPVNTGSLDKATDIVGGLRPTLRITMPLIGSGAAGTAPEFGKLLTACTYKETATAAAIGAPTAAAAGTTGTVTLDTPFGTTAQAYRGMPLVLAGDQALTTGIVDYTAGKVATLGETLADAATTSTTALIPVNMLYSPSSDESVIKSVTVYGYYDGVQYRFVGAQGTWSIQMTAGGIAMLTFELRAQFAVKTGAALPVGWNATIRPQPPIWVGGKCQLNKVSAQAGTLQLNAGISTLLPDDPEATEGFSPALAIERASGGTINPYTNTDNTFALFDAFQAGTLMPLMAMIGATAGNRFLLVAPSIRCTAWNAGNRGGLMEDGLTFQCAGADAGLFLAAF